MNKRVFNLKTIKALIIVSVLGIVGGLYGGMASSLSYQEDIGVNFTFNSALNITLSSSDIHIDNLAPGSSADSNIVNVNVLTNSPYGYTLNATVGNSTTYDTDDLVHSNSGISNVFSNTTFSSTPTITSNTNLANDTWAFSFSTDNGTNWANYNGLPMYDDTDHVAVLKESNGPVATNTGDDIKFKIGAKASSAQASGTYRNVINFNLVAAPTPVTIAMAFQSAGATQVNGYYKMQDMTSAICAAVEVEEDPLSLIDIRDNKTYMVSKLADGNCWMIQNLDLDIDSSRTYTNADTDLGYNMSTGEYETASWTPISSTYPANTTGVNQWCVGGTKDGVWCTSYVPESYDPGDLYWGGVLKSLEDWSDDWRSYKNSCNYRFSSTEASCNESLNPIADYTTSSGIPQYHLGNYYNWAAAMAVNDISDLTDSPQSICPVGWTIPYDVELLPEDDYYGYVSYENLLNEYGYVFGEDFLKTEKQPWSAPLYYIFNGYWNGSYNRMGFTGELQTIDYYNTVWFSTNEYDARYATIGYGGDGGEFNWGSAVRCVAR